MCPHFTHSRLSSVHMQVVTIEYAGTEVNKLVTVNTHKGESQGGGKVTFLRHCDVLVMYVAGSMQVCAEKKIKE